MSRNKCLFKNNFPLVMGIVNTDPQSFSDGCSSKFALDNALHLLDDGADIIDIGGESTRPGAQEVPPEIEIERVVPILTELKKLRPDVLVSIDTRKSVCAKVFLDNGADMINDVSGLQYSENMAELAASYNAYLVIMHSLGAGTSGIEHHYTDIVGEVKNFLHQKVIFAEKCGVKKENLIIDPGLGFSKNIDENFELLKNIGTFAEIAPVLIGHSRKRFIRQTAGTDSIDKTDEITALISVLSACSGAAILRVHNVSRTVEFLNILKKMRG